eukprot:gene26195-biopygen2724
MPIPSFAQDRQLRLQLDSGREHPPHCTPLLHVPCTAIQNRNIPLYQSKIEFRCSLLRGVEPIWALVFPDRKMMSRNNTREAITYLVTPAGHTLTPAFPWCFTAMGRTALPRCPITYSETPRKRRCKRNTKAHIGSTPLKSEHLNSIFDWVHFSDDLSCHEEGVRDRNRAVVEAADPARS